MRGNKSQERERPIVIDASVAIKWFIEEQHSDKALRVLKQVLDNPMQFFVPELFFFELGNVFNRLVEENNDERVGLYEALFDIGISRAMMDKELSRRVRHFQSLKLSGYDAAYLALAESINGIWITADEKAHKKVQHLGLSRLLSMY